MSSVWNPVTEKHSDVSVLHVLWIQSDCVPGRTWLCLQSSKSDRQASTGPSNSLTRTHTEITQPRDCWSTTGKSSPAKQIRGLRTKLASGRLKAISSRRASRQLQIFRLAPYGIRKRRGQPQDRKKPTAVEKTKRVEKT